MCMYVTCMNLDKLKEQFKPALGLTLMFMMYFVLYQRIYSFVQESKDKMEIVVGCL